MPGVGLTVHDRQVIERGVRAGWSTIPLGRREVQIARGTFASFHILSRAT